MDTPTSVEKDPAYWRLRAEQARQAAERETDPTVNKTLLEIAEAYAKLVVLAEARFATTLPE
jgi:hypothetical protein